MDKYNPAEIETKWQQVWEEERAFEAPDPETPGSADRSLKSYVLEMLPYPSGSLHMGHVKNYTMGDVIARFRARNGSIIFHPMGYDAFGLPAENAAIKTGLHPAELTRINTENIKKQLHRLGVSIDWSRELATCDPEYYRWTQYFFLKFYERGLAYRKEAAVNWCPSCATVLANEQVVQGGCERCGATVEIRNLAQWFLKITDYAERLLKDFDQLQSWPERVITMQRNWIGRSEGAEVIFGVEDTDIEIPVFTTRPDTLFGATFFLLAPEHELVNELVDGTEYETAVREYCALSRMKSTADRSETEREKTGVFTGHHALNPVNGEKIPIWVSDYVLMEYGTGAIMAVPAHDQRDFEFARKFGIDVRVVVTSPDGAETADAGPTMTAAFEEEGMLVNSGRFDGVDNREAGKAITGWLETEGKGKGAISYRLRDWLVSRQRYWGAPIPMIYCEKCGIVPVPEKDLPVLLPEVDDYAPKGKSPIATNLEFVNTTCPQCGGAATRETDTMDTFVDSSWYFLRYTDPSNDREPFDPAIVNFWMPVDQYIGGVEHAILHLMYARFFTKVLYDLDMVDFEEPFNNLFTQGMIYYQGAKMSKSKGNVVNPDDHVQKYGADALRLYILFIGPPELDVEWQDQGIDGTFRFLGRVWRLVSEIIEKTEPLSNSDFGRVDADALKLVRKANQTIAKVSADISERFRFNTAISAVMELVNDAYLAKDGLFRSDDGRRVLRFVAETVVRLLDPFSPHVCAELWDRLGNGRLWLEPWRNADERFLEDETYELVVQVNGKVRDRLQAARSAGKEELLKAAHASEKVARYTADKQVVKEIVVPGRLVNLVVK
ncbi:MAG: leucine--tRNA ligase [Actinobacteria bacterium]|nr:leucine--tRNA ligase [Actinomycetota bacterium]